MDDIEFGAFCRVGDDGRWVLGVRYKEESKGSVCSGSRTFWNSQRGWGIQLN